MSEEKQQQDAENPEDTTTEDNQATEDVDYKAELAKYKAIAERKAKQLEKVQSSIQDEPEKKTDEPKETNTQTGLSKEEAKLYLKGFEDEDIARAELVAKEKGISLSEAAKDEYVQDKLKARKDKERSVNAELSASRGPVSAPKKSPSEMSRAEHEEWYRKEIEKASRG